MRYQFCFKEQDGDWSDWYFCDHSDFIRYSDRWDYRVRIA